MTNAQLPFHESFEREQILAEGYLLLSNNYPRTAIREVNQINSDDDKLNLAKSSQQELEILENYGITTVRPRPVITECGLAFVCERVTGNPLDTEIENGNDTAVNMYGETLLKLTRYYSEATGRNRSPIYSDIVAPSQYTWQNDEAVLHDISTVMPADHKSSFVALNSCQIAYEYTKLHDLIDQNTSNEITNSLSGIIDQLDDDPFTSLKYIHFLKLTVSIATGSRSDALNSLAEAFMDDVFES